MIYYLISISSLFPTLFINHHFTFILHFIPFSYSNFQRNHVHHDTDYSTYFEHHHAFERITRPWIYLSNLFFHWRGKILLSHTNVHGDSNIDSVFSIFSLWYEFGTNCTSWMRLVSYQWVSNWHFNRTSSIPFRTPFIHLHTFLSPISL